jgi:hypothetical protein
VCVCVCVCYSDVCMYYVGTLQYSLDIRHDVQVLCACVLYHWRSQHVTQGGRVPTEGRSAARRCVVSAYERVLLCCRVTHTVRLRSHCALCRMQFYRTVLLVAAVLARCACCCVHMLNAVRDVDAFARTHITRRWLAARVRWTYAYRTHRVLHETDHTPPLQTASSCVCMPSQRSCC